MEPKDFWGNRVARGDRSRLLLNHLEPDERLVQSETALSQKYEIKGAKG